MNILTVQDCLSSNCICTVRPLSINSTAAFTKPVCLISIYHLSWLVRHAILQHHFYFYEPVSFPPVLFQHPGCCVHSAAVISSYLFPQRAGRRDSECNEKDHWDDVRRPSSPGAADTSFWPPKQLRSLESLSFDFFHPPYQQTHPCPPASAFLLHISPVIENYILKDDWTPHQLFDHLPGFLTDSIQSQGGKNWCT